MGIYGPGYPVEANNDYMYGPEAEASQRIHHHNHHHSIVGMERYHQQQIRRGSPLAQVGHPVPEEDNEIAILDSPMIDAPVPKHRHQISISLQKELEGVENYQRQNGHQHRHHHQDEAEPNPEGFNTNPVSPAPAMAYPEQPEIPHVEHDVHNGPELRSNPDDDVSDEETEKVQNKKAALARDRELQTGIKRHAYEDNTVSLPMPEAQVPGSQNFGPQEYPLPHRGNSLSQMQHDYDINDPRQNSALAMIMSGAGIGSGLPQGRSSVFRPYSSGDVLSEDERTNLSDAPTNPSVPTSPVKKFSKPATANTHTHQMSSNSNAWMSDNARPSGSVTSSSTKFNAEAKEFKFEPGASSSFSFSPKTQPFVPGSVGSSPISAHSRDHSRNQSASAFGVRFGTSNFNANATTFRPSFPTGPHTVLFEKGAAAFSPNAPAFTPSSLAKPVPTSQPLGTPSPIFSPVTDHTTTVKKAPSVVRPPSRLNVNQVAEAVAEDANGDRRDVLSADEGGRKRAKHGPALSVAKDTEVPSLESLTPTRDTVAELGDAPDAAALAESGSETEGEKLIEEVPTVPVDGGAGLEDSSFQPFEFKNSEDAAEFAIAHSRWDGPSRRESRLDILTAGDQLSIEEAQFIAADTPQDTLSERNPTPPILQVATPPIKKFNPNAPSFSHDPTAQEFNFEFTPGPKPPSPLSRKLGGIGESRYAHTPSPPPSDPPPPPPVTHNMPAFTPPIDDSPYHPSSDPYKTNAFGEPITRPMPTDAELDEVIQQLTVSDPTFADQEVREPGTSDGDATPEEPEHRTLSSWKRGSPKRMGIPTFDEQTPQHVLNHLDRSAGPSPSPRRAATVPPYTPHRASSFSPDEETYGRAHAAGGASYQPPSQEIGVAKEADSDWDDMVSGSEDAKLRPQSRLFFDAHVEELVGGLLRASLEPMNKSISSIHDLLRTYSALYPGRRGSALSTAAHSDADDEDDDDGFQPPRSPRKDRKVEIRSAVVEALTMHNWSSSTEDKLSEIYGAIAKISRAFQDNNLNDDLAETRASILEALLKTAQSEEVAAMKDTITASAKAAVKTVAELAEFKATFINSFSQLAQVGDVNAVRDSLEEMMANVPSPGLVDIKLGLQDILVKTAQRGDVGELSGAVARMGQEVARREDLEHFQNIAIDVFSKVVKSNDLLEVKVLLSDIQKAVAGVNFASDNTALISMLGDVMKVTRDSAENIDFHQESQESVIKDNYEALREKFDAIHESISGIAKLIEERSLTNGTQQPLAPPDIDLAYLKSVVEKIDRGVQLSSERQLGLDDFRQVIEKLSVSQPRLEQIKEVVSDAVADVSELGDIRSMVEEVFETQPKMEDLRQMMEELFMKHKTEEVAKKVSDVNVEEMQWNMTRLERMLAETQKRADEEAQLRRDSREKAVELEARLRIAEEECIKQRELVEERDRRLKAIDEKRHQTLTQTQMRSALLEGAHSSLQKSVTDLSTKNTSLEVGLKEAQQTSERLREDNNKYEEENRELRRVIDTMRTEMEESIRVREKNRGKFDKLQEDMTTAAEEIGKEQGKWQKTSEEQKARIEVLEARLESELTAKESLESEVRRLELEQKEAIKIKVELEQVKKASGKMEEMVETLKKEASERDQQIGEMETTIQEDRSSIALQEAEKAKSAALLVQQREYERQLDITKSRYEDESHQIKRALGNANEDIQRTKDFMKERLSIASSESEILREHISHLKEQVKVATSAAQAAAQAATSAKLLATPATHNASEEMALRESVEVLQSQLQQREARIEALEQELSKFDKVDIKRKDEQITWLRELLEVRIDELEEVVHALSLPNFERERDSIRDTALRLKTNLQMERQEKERAERKETSPAPNALAARLPSVATNAWASWRGKGTGTPSQTPSQTSSTPSRPTSAAGFLGILTPPSASAALGNARGLGSRFSRGPYASDTSHQSLPAYSTRQREKQPAGRRLPPQLFYKASYDDDAESSTVLSPGRTLPMEETDDDDATERGDDDKGSEVGGYYNRQ